MVGIGNDLNQTIYRSPFKPLRMWLMILM